MEPLKEGEQKNSKDQENSKDENLGKNQKDPKRDKSVGEKLKNAAVTVVLVMAAVLLFSLGPIGILLGILTLLFAAKKPIAKLAKKAYISVKKKITADKNTKKVKSKKVKKDKSKNKKKEKTSSLEMNVASLKKMKTRPNSVSKIDVIPAERAKSTSNGLQPNFSKFQSLIVPSVKISDVAMKRRNKPIHDNKRTPLPNMKNVKPTL
ncbi:hypothetical protein [Flavobacterium sp. LAR06]|uniref:hypothetical protein n=1 Tax=Flavobacterium sp. LAR06 TaxID=3064897 RepID=UPI0035C0DFF9